MGSLLKSKWEANVSKTNFLHGKVTMRYRVTCIVFHVCLDASVPWIADMVGISR